MATIEQAVEASGFTLEQFRKLTPAQRMIFSARADAGTPMPNTARIDRIRDESNLAQLEVRLARLNGESPARFANGRALQTQTREFITDRIAGIRRRMTAS
jgi:S-adenosylmethionine:diacylglycerol 3-amino-3-carboxypropyl transferase